jgi:integral membrane sensor domain MASE1
VANRLVNSLSPKNFALLASLALVYFVVAKLGRRMAFVHPYVTPMWIPAGIAVVAFILFGYRVWPAIFIGNLLEYITTAGFVTNTLVIPIASTLEGIAGAYLVNKFAHGVKAFDTAQGVFRFVLFACICAPAINPTLGLGIEYLTGSAHLASFGFRWLTWWLGFGIGTLLVAPFLILLLRTPHHRLDGGDLLELTVLLLGLIFVCLLVFGPLSVSLNKNRVVQAWLCVPFLICAAFRFSQLEAAGTTLILFGSAIWGTLHGYGSFVAKNLTTSLILLDTFIGVIGTMTLVVATMVVERRQIEQELLGTQSLLQDAVEGKDRDLVVTIRALEIETAGHVQSKKALRESHERLRRIAANAKIIEEKTQEVQTHRERLE